MESLLAKTLGASQLIYTASMISVPDTAINTVQSHLFSFLWKNKKDKIKRNVAFQPLSEGGLNFINFKVMVKSLRLAWISGLLSNSNDNWKAIPNFYFENYGGLLFLLKIVIIIPLILTKTYLHFIANYKTIFEH